MHTSVERYTCNGCGLQKDNPAVKDGYPEGWSSVTYPLLRRDTLHFCCACSVSVAYLYTKFKIELDPVKESDR